MQHLKAAFRCLPRTEGYLGMVATSMVFMTGVDRDNNFSQPIPVSPYCTPDVCYQAATRSKVRQTSMRG